VEDVLLRVRDDLSAELGVGLDDRHGRSLPPGRPEGPSGDRAIVSA
jgi:hypothetical protein